MKIIVFGAGKAADQILTYPLKPEVEIIFVCDNDSGKWGQSIGGYGIVNPKDIKNTLFDYVLLATWNGQALNEIVEQLVEFGVHKDKIVFSYDPSMLEYCQSRLDEFFAIPKVPYNIRFEKNKVYPRPECHGETSKSRGRREREGFFRKYCQGAGLDIGCGADPVVPGVSGWDHLNGDAQYIREIENESFDYVYSSHCLEHMFNVRIALYNWFRVVRPGGYLIIAVPHKELYEKKECLPSRFNGDHKHMFLIGRSEQPDTLDIIEEIRESLTSYEIIYVKICDEGHTITDPLLPSDGEYQIEAVIQKRK